MDWERIDDSPNLIRELLEARRLGLKKRWGQNFMIDRPARGRIVDLLGVEQDADAWEIGPGLGAITAMLLARTPSVTVFEVDWGLVRVIQERFGGQVVVVAGDAVTTLADAARQSPRFVVGNLPYRSAAPIVVALLERSDIISVKRIVITVQREMAQRIVARPGGKEYSAFSVLCSIAAESTLHGDLSRGCFYPHPAVVSSIVSLRPRPVDPNRLRAASLVARSLFSSRRKTVANNLAPLQRLTGLDAGEILSVWESLGVSAGVRAESIEPEVFALLGDALLPHLGEAIQDEPER